MAEPSELEKAVEKVTPEQIADRYESIERRTERLDRLCDLLPGVSDPLDAVDREELISREEWESRSEASRKKAVGFLYREHLRDRHQLHPPLHFHQSGQSDVFDRAHAKAIEKRKLVFRYRKNYPKTALSPAGTIPVEPLIGLVPRMKTTPTEDLPVILNSRLFHFVWVHYHGETSGEDAVPHEERLAGFQCPMLTKRTGEEFRELRDEIRELSEKNAELLVERDRMHKLAEEAGVPLVPVHRTEGIVREVNVPRPLTEVAGVARRGPVVIFRRGSTIVTTTEEAATYLELWLRWRFDRLRGMTKEDLEEFLRLPSSTAQVVVVLQRRAEIEEEIDESQDRIDELQEEAEQRLYDLYDLTEAEREWLRIHYG